MSNKINKYCLILFLIVGLGSLITCCTYYPRLTGIPLIREKGDTRIEGGVTFVLPNAQVAVAHGITENIASTVSASYIPVIYDEGMHLHVDAAIGYYKNLQNRYVFEQYFGFAYGHDGSMAHFIPNNRQRGNYQMYFSQINFGFIEKKPSNLELGIGIKFGYFHSNMINDLDWHPTLYKSNINGIFAEPTLIARKGGGKWKFKSTLGFGRVFPLKIELTLNSIPVNFGFGASYSFGGSKSYSNNIKIN